MTEQNQETINTTRIVTIIAALVIIVGVYFFLTTPKADKKKYGQTNYEQSEIEIGGEFELTNLEGIKENTTKFEGQYRLVYFGFTYCPDICPTALNLMSNVIDTLEKYNIKIIPIFVTIDPARDTTQVLKPYLAHFHQDIIGYTGTEAEIRKVADMFKVYYAKVERPEHSVNDYLVDHSSFFYLLDGKGKYIRHFSSSSKAIEMANSILKIVKDS